MSITHRIFAAALFFALASCTGSADHGAGAGPEPSASGGRNTYAAYRERHANAAPAEADIPLDIFAYAEGSGIEELAGFQGEERALLSGEESFVEYLVQVDHPGFYTCYLEYFPVASRGISIERSFSIDGEVPFLNAERLSFSRIWGDGGPVRTDNQGNQIRPTQVELPRWETAFFRDPTGYSAEPYRFYLSQGEHRIRLTGSAEPMAIRRFELRAPTSEQPYAEYAAGFDTSRFQNRDKTLIVKVQGEDAARRSDPALYARYDRSSGQTEPANPAQITLNMIGGDPWKTPGQWIEWEVEVPEDGMYRISLKVRQKYNRGFVSSRAVLIDGIIPCTELQAAPFRYRNAWDLSTLRDAEGNDLYFPLSRGTHRIRLQVTLGELGGMLETMEESIFRLNGMYRRILVLTGAEPDPLRDYRLERVYPDIIEAMAAESRVLYKLADDLTRYSGERSSQSAAILTLARQLELYAERPDKLPPALSGFKGAIGSLGDGIIALTESKLDVDYILVSAAEAKLPKMRENFITAAYHELRSLAASFMVDYNNLGDVYEGSGAVDVWLLTGRDQSTIVKSMVDDSFTPQTGIPVNVRLVEKGVVMPAVVAGTGPDVAIPMAVSEPVNYALRDAAIDLSQFDDYPEVAKRFHRSAVVPFEYNGGVYALPETQNFSIMFYRTDILEELELEPPETWDDLLSMMPVLQKNNMNAGIPSMASGTDMSGYLITLYQRGGALYDPEGSRTILDRETPLAAFEAYTRFFTHYMAPQSFDFINRFRSGEIPVGIADIENFNKLEVSAPEIRGLWQFALLPGTFREDGRLDRSITSTVTGSILFSRPKRSESSLRASWEFMKWWTSAETQARYARELESVMGAAARYATANTEAFDRLSWRVSQLTALREQRSWAVGIPEVPGGYYVSRNITNAVRKVLNERVDTRETLLNYNRLINEELIKKRKEFGLEK
ncbi:MAG: extracellular solute-binding protein [Treponema sp.]|jgi:ABC-type glycerol-3-phosphate transport system substrate-binding protein|nr:extracellular solute-binding protein [Treponema sp.]